MIALPITSQNISTGEIKTSITPQGDTLIILPLEDAKIILSDLLQYEITDSILEIYKERDSLNLNTSKAKSDNKNVFDLDVLNQMRKDRDNFFKK